MGGPDDAKIERLVQFLQSHRFIHDCAPDDPAGDFLFKEIEGTGDLANITRVPDKTLAAGPRPVLRFTLDNAFAGSTSTKRFEYHYFIDENVYMPQTTVRLRAVLIAPWNVEAEGIPSGPEALRTLRYLANGPAQVVQILDGGGKTIYHNRTLDRFLTRRKEARTLRLEREHTEQTMLAELQEPAFTCVRYAPRSDYRSPSRA